jgi:lipopolysaccharide transport system ATP-binding protein
MQPAIRVENLSKRYRLGATRVDNTQTEALQAGLGWVGRGLTGRKKVAAADASEFWALRDVSFEVKPGEVVGIIGRNGAGKSTLLKVLSRIVEPTGGRAVVRGRMGSLLEVGTGFHPELTGRENIYLNGSILGMSQREIARKFDEIVAFSGVERFLDTPVKRYSSGMYVRLAFAVAAHLEPEILIVDEVLAVGDAEFQQRCLGKMSEVAKEGRTILFVSHNMGAIAILCDRGVLLEGGRVVYSGSAEGAIGAYNAVAKETGHVYTAPESLPTPHFRRIEVFQEGRDGPPFRIDRPIVIRFEIENYGKQGLLVGFRVRSTQGVTVIHSSDEFLPTPPSADCKVRHCLLPPYALAEGTYYLRAGFLVRGGDMYQALDDVVSFRVEFAGRMAERSTGRQWLGVTGPGLVKWDLGHPHPA